MQNFYHTINLNALSSHKHYSNVNCAEYKELKWLAAAVFELASDNPDSHFQIDFEDCNMSEVQVNQWDHRPTSSPNRI